MLQQFILPAISFGLSAVTIPGPLQAYLLNVTLNYGWRRGLLVILSPLITDGPIILLAVFVLQRIPDSALQLIRIGGGLLLLWIAWGAWQQLRAGARFDVDADVHSGSVRAIISRAVAMNVLSPGPWLFWSTITGPLLKEALEISLASAIGILLAFYGTFLGGMALLVIVFHRIGQIGTGATHYLLLLTIFLLLWYGTRLILVDALALPIVHQGLVVLLFALAAIYWIIQRQTLKRPPPA